MTGPEGIGVELYWIPLGAGGVGFVRFNGWVYEAVAARRARRPPRQLYHTALEVATADGRFVIENAWPSPDGDTASRGVVVEGPVFSRRLARFRPFRYEVRCWRDGVIADADAAAEARRVSDEPAAAQRLVDLAATVPPMVWGRDEIGAGEMWNSNSVISWLLVKAGVDMRSMKAPEGGRAPGWDAGITVAKRQAQKTSKPGTSDPSLT